MKVANYYQLSVKRGEPKPFSSLLSGLSPKCPRDQIFAAESAFDDCTFHDSPQLIVNHSRSPISDHPFHLAVPYNFYKGGCDRILFGAAKDLAIIPSS
ncbi:hypothetical protein AVEN_237390-1 [Araneus ventricosus]|uniref:Uncharacterized protein n=1 Tax=Araneus ventricosus TaxID=182803 RepID=A0A4Y2JWA4_ARAVE|nr:hypothetical protein AVEN_237390-1 [Araneus ventricosus]